MTDYLGLFSITGLVALAMLGFAAFVFVSLVHHAFKTPGGRWRLAGAVLVLPLLPFLRLLIFPVLWAVDRRFPMRDRRSDSD